MKKISRNLTFNEKEYKDIVLLSKDMPINSAHLFAWFDDGEFVSMNAGAMCYGSEPRKGIISHCAESNHNTVLEHSLYSFIIKVPIFTARQDLRARVGTTYDERSLRYCRADDGTLQYYIPPALKLPQHRTELDEWISQHENAIKLYSKLTDEEILDGEQARAILPVGIATTYVSTKNAWSWRTQLKKRLCMLAQTEIRQVYRQIEKQLKEVSPLYFSDVNMPCMMSEGCHELKKCDQIPLDFTRHWSLSYLRSYREKKNEDTWRKKLYDLSTKE